MTWWRPLAAIAGLMLALGQPSPSTAGVEELSATSRVKKVRLVEERVRELEKNVCRLYFHLVRTGAISPDEARSAAPPEREPCSGTGSNELRSEGRALLPTLSETVELDAAGPMTHGTFSE